MSHESWTNQGSMIICFLQATVIARHRPIGQAFSPPAMADPSASFNIRFNNKHTSYKLKNKINKIIKKICNKNKSKFKIEYNVSGEAFLTKPNKTTFMIQNTIKKVTKIKPKLSTTGGTSDARFIRKIAPCLEFGLVGKTMHKVGECVSLSDLKRLTLIYTKILDNYFK